MKDIRTLRFLDGFSRLFELIGVNYPAMRRILQVKLTMDQRRVPTVLDTGKKKKEGNQFLKSLWFYALMGLIIIPFVLLEVNLVFQMGIAAAIIMFIVVSTMISDFSSVLLDIRDSNILHSKPLNKRTISAAKTLHIGIYMFFLTGAVTAVPLIVSFSAQGPLFFLIFLFEIVLIDLLVVFFTALLYFSVLKFFDGEKLKDIINYVQIGLSMGIMVGYQLVARSFEFMNLTIVYHPEWWQVLLPPVWYGALFEWLYHPQSGGIIVTGAVLALVVPIISIFIYIKMMPAFERNLQKLSENSSKNKKSYSGIKKMICTVVCWNKEEKVFFRFADTMMKNEREFKLKVYPSLGFSVVLPFLFLANELNQGSVETLSTSKSFVTIYALMIVIPTIVMTLRYSGTYKGVWVFRTTPVESPAPLIKATLKAFIVKLFMPIFIIVSAVFLWLFAASVWIHLLIALAVACLYTVICYLMFERFLPFSDSFEAFQQSEGWKFIPLVLIIVAFGAIHYFVTFVSFGPLIYFAVLLVVNWIVWKKTLAVSWGDI